jgi:hypothetical protein
MRNLLGRLNSRSPSELTQIADSWQTPLAGRDRLAQVSQIYRSMTRLPMVRGKWDALDTTRQAIVRALIAAGESGRTLGDLGTEVGIKADDLRPICMDLYEQGLIAFEGTASTLPVGESPRLFVPLELAHAFRQVDHEVELGDISGQSLDALIESRDDRDLFDAAAHWGIDVITGVTTRDQVAVALHRVTAAGSARHAQIDALGNDVRMLWDKLRTAPPGTAVPVYQLLGAGSERTLYGRRNALNELEDRLLIWPAVLGGSTRAYFVPAEIGGEATHVERDVIQPKPVSVIGSEPPYRPMAPLAWDLAVALQRMFGPLAPPNLDPLSVPRPFASDLGRLFWNRGKEQPPVGYLELLVELAISLGLVQEPEDGATQFERTQAIRDWRLKSWLEQTARIRSVWMSSGFWIEGQGRQDVEPWNVDWRGFRVKLLGHLAALDKDRWFRLSDISRWISDYDPGILGPDATVALAQSPATTDRSTHLQGVEYLVTSVIRTMLVWMGYVQLHEPGRNEHLISISEEVRRITRAEVAESMPAPLPPEISVADDLTSHLVNPEPIHVWSVIAFADVLSLGRESVFAITADSIRNAQAAGFLASHITQFFERIPGTRPPADMADRLRVLAEQAEGFELSTALVVDAPSETVAFSARGLLENEGYVVGQVGRRLYVSIGTQRSAAADTERIHARLLAIGMGQVTNRSRSS